jgi:catechol 2,3-dioxygenase-like lactoylglutathione lyase family enzyme
MKLSHLSLGVSNLDESEKFYRDILSLPALREGSEVFVQWPDFLLVLVENPPADRSKFHFGFEVGTSADVDMWADRLRKEGVQIVSGPATEEGTRHLFFLDPDQYVIEIFSNH